MTCEFDVLRVDLKKTCDDKSGLRLISASGVCIKPEEFSCNDSALAVRRQAGHIHPLAFIDRKIWNGWKKNGWVVRDDVIERDAWRISNAGRLQLKCLMSRTSTSSTVSLYPPVARQQPAKPEQDCESPLLWLRKRHDKEGRPFLADAEFYAGERLRADFTYAQMNTRVTASWSPIVVSRARKNGGMPYRSGGDEAASVSDAAERVRGALRAVGPDFADVLLDVCCYQKGMTKIEQMKGWPQRSGKLVLKLALASLSRYYGEKVE